jgi:hypothetical protein
MICFGFGFGFGIASVNGGLARNGTEPIVARGLQGVFAALLAPPSDQAEAAAVSRADAAAFAERAQVPLGVGEQSLERRSADPSTLVSGVDGGAGDEDLRRWRERTRRAAHRRHTRIRQPSPDGRTHVHLLFVPAWLSSAVGRPSVRHVDTRRTALTGSSTTVSWVALASAVVAGVVLWVADAVWYGIPESGGPGVSLLFIGGWSLLTCAAFVAVGVLIHLVVSALRRRGGAPLEFVLPAATIVLIAVILLAHPLAGSASA